MLIVRRWQSTEVTLIVAGLQDGVAARDCSDLPQVALDGLEAIKSAEKLRNIPLRELELVSSLGGRRIRKAGRTR